MMLKDNELIKAKQHCSFCTIVSEATKGIKMEKKKSFLNFKINFFLQNAQYEVLCCLGKLNPSIDLGAQKGTLI